MLIETEIEKTMGFVVIISIVGGISVWEAGFLGYAYGTMPGSDQYKTVIIGACANANIFLGKQQSFLSFFNVVFLICLTVVISHHL